MNNNRMKRSRLFMLCLIAMFSCSISGFAQMLKGKVTDVNNQPLPGVTIVIKGTTNGTISDMDGNYNLKLNDASTDVIVASFIGMESQEIAVLGKTVINVVMKDETTQLDEVVAVGYGTVKKRDITGSVTSVKGNDLKEVPVADAVQAMQGRMAGVQITSNEGSPDADMTIKIRGGGSITQDNAPLYIVDGFPVSSLNDIPSSDIESIDVLKDASSTAIYGSRGANGVIIVTTKSGKEGKTTVSYNAYYGVNQIAKTLDVLNPYDYVKWQWEYNALRYGMDDISDMEHYTDYFGNYQDIGLYEGLKGNNWQDQIYGRIGNVFSHDVNVSGGSEKMTYSLSYSNFKQKAIMRGSDYNRNNLNFKLQHKPNDKVKINFSARYSDTKVNGSGSTDSDGSTSDARLIHSVVYTPIPLDGGVANAVDDDEISSYLINPITATDDNDREKHQRRLNLSSSFQWEILKDLKFKTDVGYDTYDYDNNRFYGLSAYYNRSQSEYPDNPAGRFITKRTQKIRNTNTLNYDLKQYLSEGHSLSVLLGQEIIHETGETITTWIDNYPESFDAEDAFNLTSQGNSLSYDDSYSTPSNLLSFFGRVNYSYNSNYMAALTFRADGSSKFGDGNKWGYFPSLAVAWRISGENFMSGTKDWLDDLKLRLSYGTAGNNNIPSGQTSALYTSQSSSSSIYINGVDNFLYVDSSDMPNANLKWETTYTRNVGIDYTLFNSKLSGSIEGYYNTTKDLLMEAQVPGSGYKYQYQNIGETENTGAEFSVNWVAVDKSNFGLNVGFNVAFNKNNVVSLGSNEYINTASGWTSDISVDYKVLPGHAVGEMYGYKVDGRYEVSDFSGYDENSDTWTLNDGVADDSEIVGDLRPGMIKLKDISGDEDGTVDENDRTIIGNANPIASGGLTLNARVYNFDIAATFNYSYGNDVYNANKIEFTTMTQNDIYRNMTSDMASGKRWTNIDPSTGEIVNDAATLQEMNANTTMWSPYMKTNFLSDYAVEDGSFVRLGSFTIGYSIPSAILEKYKLTKLRFYATGSNLFCLTNYSGMDPEVSTRTSTPLSPGVDFSAYPRARQVVFGVNLNF